MIRRAARFAAASLGCLCTAAGQGDEVVHVRSLALFEPPSLQLPWALVSSLPDDGASNHPVALHARDARAPDGAWVVAFARARHAEAIAAGRVTLNAPVAAGDVAADDAAPRPTSLVVRGAAAEVEACVRELDAIAAGLGRAIEVTAWRLPLGSGELPPTTWDAAALQQSLERTTPLWSARARTRPGGAVRLAQERGIGYVRDVDVESAERASVPDPKVDVAFAGVRATATVDPLPDGGLLLRGSWLLTEPVALREQAIGRGRSNVELPDHRTAWVSFAGRVPDGGALVVAGRGGAVGPEGFVLVVSARCLAPLPPDPAPDLIVRPVGAVLVAREAIEPRLGTPRPGEDVGRFVRLDRDGGIAREGLLRTLGAESPIAAQLAGDVLVLHADAGECRRIDALLGQLARDLRNVPLRSAVDDGEGGRLELSQPGLGSRAIGAFLGRETAYVRDHEVEIAVGLGATNPVIGIAHGGLWLGALATGVGSEWHVRGTWSVAAHAALRLREGDEAPPMSLQLVDYRTTTLPWDALMPAGQQHALGDGPAWVAGGPATKVSVALIAS